MLDSGLGNQSEQEALREKIAVFNAQKQPIQDHVLERTNVVPEKAIKEIMKKFKLPEEIAKVIFVFEFEYNIPRELSADFYLHEFSRLKKVNFDLPDIYSFLVRFSLEEGFWIKYTSVDFPKKMKRKISKLVTLDRSLFGDLEGSKEDSALYIMERSFLLNEIINPMLHSWVKDHHRSTFFDATCSIICGMRHKAREKGQVILTELYNRLHSNLESIKGIISELDAKGWANKAIKEFEVVQEIVNECEETDLTTINSRMAAELILENRLVLEYENLDLSDEIISGIELKVEEQTSSTASTSIEKREEDLVIDKLSMALTTLEDLPAEKWEEFFKKLVDENFDEATKIKRQKPSYFAKEFFEVMMDKLLIEQNIASKEFKKFENKLMYRLSPMGSKDHPNLSVDEKVTTFLVEAIIDIYQRRDKLQPKEKLLKKQQAIAESKKDKPSEIDLKVEEKPPLVNQLRELPDKEIWLLIRDSYLKELFDNVDELKAGSKVLKKLSLELGLLLTENEATSLIQKELEKKELSVEEGNKEEIDRTICKVIFDQIKEQRQFQTKIA